VDASVESVAVSADGPSDLDPSLDIEADATVGTDEVTVRGGVDADEALELDASVGGELDDLDTVDAEVAANLSAESVRVTDSGVFDTSASIESNVAATAATELNAGASVDADATTDAGVDVAPSVELGDDSEIGQQLESGPVTDLDDLRSDVHVSDFGETTTDEPSASGKSTATDESTAPIGTENDESPARATSNDDAPVSTGTDDDARSSDEGQNSGDRDLSGSNSEMDSEASPTGHRLGNGSALGGSAGFGGDVDGDSGGSGPESDGSSGSSGDAIGAGSDDGPLGSLPEEVPASAPAGAAVGVGLLVGYLASRTADPVSVGSVPSAAQIRSLVSGARAHVRYQLHRLPRFIPFPGYSRYDDSDPLQNETRAAVFETIEDAPGAHLSRVSDDADVARSTVRYHVRVLEEEGLVTSAKVRSKRRFYPARTEDVELAAAVEDDATAAVLDAVRRLEPASGSAVADAVDRDASTVSHHLSRLAESGLVERERDGPAVENSLAPAVRAALDRVEATPADAEPASAEAD